MVAAAGHKTQKFPAMLPMQHPYEEDEFFVRDCYETLYDEVIEELFTKGKHCVTITGAPGNGKSIFYAYFFQRFRHDPDRQHFVILTTAFTQKSKIIQAAAFKGERDEAIGRSVWPFSPEFNTSVWQATGDDILRLYDGPPSVEVPYPEKMVCFTSPNENWFGKFDKDRTKQTLYMPVWTPAELWTAATLLGYDRRDPPLTEDMINDRFEKFGGVAREGLELSERFVQSHLERLEAAIKEMAPDVLLERISTAEFEERSKLIRYLRGISEGAAFRGYLVEMKAHELLVHGMNGKGIVAVLKSLGLFNNAIKHPRSVVLIFVGPEPKPDQERLKSAQTIPWDLLANSESVDILPGVGVEKKHELERIHIRTVEDLREAVVPKTTAQKEFFKRHNLGSYVRILSKFDRGRKSIRDMLQGIPQYVWEVM
ncbi:hypothetical protein PHYSODRAFT_496946 [Phytophthora sojae]|uniref:Uncharacterized protein n=1 Tax=Phytophthora sojae (strain P6497) TaxID=1094619 RepID=G4Z8R8_PHYSP|nr:hypothetical protein PHYSODRAFT_496946 [Phytophthora sojae]EGZ19100.1 hypothetical protein PHYSODRAFT_496946 [Phytophthora sojae]|eukprot:XP_009521817.1 hypothetical protein PHYSODRAFT_496946 [Phytophthora sojae]